MMESIPHGNYLTIARSFTLEMAHVLENHKGKCRNIHGHSYTVEVELSGQLCREKGHPAEGMLMDYKDLKTLVGQELVEPFDHSLLVHKRAALAPAVSNKAFGKTVLLDFRPTCENLASHFAQKIVKVLPKGIMLYRLRLYETAQSYAQWHGS